MLGFGSEVLFFLYWKKRATILTSEGERDAKINHAQGEKQRVVKESEAIKMRVATKPAIAIYQDDS